MQLSLSLPLNFNWQLPQLDLNDKEGVKVDVDGLRCPTQWIVTLIIDYDMRLLVMVGYLFLFYKLIVKNSLSFIRWDWIREVVHLQIDHCLPAMGQTIQYLHILSIPSFSVTYYHFVGDDVYYYICSSLIYYFSFFFWFVIHLTRNN